MKIIPLLKKIVYEKKLKSQVKIFFLCSFLFLIMEYLSNTFLLRTPITNINAYHSNLLTINSLFCGFALTNLSILISINDNEMVKIIKKTNILQKRNILITLSLFCSSVAMICSLYFILEIDSTVLCLIGNIPSLKKVSKVYIVINNYIFCNEIWFLILGTSFFIASIKKMVELLNYIYKMPQKLSEEQKKDLLEIQSKTRDIEYEEDSDTYD